MNRGRNRRVAFAAAVAVVAVGVGIEAARLLDFRPPPAGPTQAEKDASEARMRELWQRSQGSGTKLTAEQRRQVEEFLDRGYVPGLGKDTAPVGSKGRPTPGP